MGCGESTTGGSATLPGGVNNDDEPYMEDVHDHASESQVLESNAEITEALAGGEMTFESQTPFMAALLNLRGQQLFELEYATVAADGTRSAWSPVEVDLPEEVQTSASIMLDAPAKKLLLRTVETNTSLEYLDVRFFGTLPESGVLDVHYEYAEEEEELEQLETTSQFLTRKQLVRVSGRYIPPASTVAAGRSQRVSYTGAPAWRRSNCGGTFRPGTRALAEYLVANFDGARSYGGYSCRPNTANTSQMSVHGTGRAIDLMVRTISGDADNTAGDPIANWLIENAQSIGVQYIIWDRTSWNASRSGDKHRTYTGPNKHVDHLHIELSPQGAEQNTPWHRDPSNASSPGSGGSSGPNPIPGEGVTCQSRTLGRSVPKDECVQMSYVAYGGRCNWAVCNDSGRWIEQSDPNGCPGATHSNASCGATNQPTVQPPAPTNKDKCASRTLGRLVDHGTCVQVDYEGNSCERCGWYACDDGAWTCSEPSSCSGEKASHANCADPGTTPNELRIRLEWNEETDLDLFVREPSGALLSYASNGISSDDGKFYNESSCRGSNCANIPKPYYEDAVWGERSKQVKAGEYTFWVANYNARSASSFTVKVTRTDASGTLTTDESFSFNLAAQAGKETEKKSITIQ